MPDCSALTWVEVKAPVLAQVGRVHLHLFPYRCEPIPPDDSDERPWAWGAMCRVRFRIGELVTTKKVQVKHQYIDDPTWKWHARPSDEALAEGRQKVLTDLRTMLARHGFEPPVEFDIEEHEHDYSDPGPF